MCLQSEVVAGSFLVLWVIGHTGFEVIMGHVGEE